MTKLDPSLPMSKAREMQFYNLIKSQQRMSRWAVIDSMNITIQMFQREYTTYLSKYPQIKYLKESKEFLWDP